MSHGRFSRSPSLASLASVEEDRSVQRSGFFPTEGNEGNEGVREPCGFPGLGQCWTQIDLTLAVVGLGLFVWGCALVTGNWLFSTGHCQGVQWLHIRVVSARVPEPKISRRGVRKPARGGHVGRAEPMLWGQPLQPTHRRSLW
jgi:hypothetical protein